MPRLFELSYSEGTHTRLTITDTRITLKYATTAPDTAETLSAVSVRIAEQVPEGTPSLRGTFRRGSRISLYYSRSQKLWRTFNVNGEVTGARNHP